MKKLLTLLLILTSAAASAVVRDIPRDSIMMSDPCILADSVSGMYYITGTGGRLWKSTDLARWTGPYKVVEIDTCSWMGRRPAVWAAEIHQYKGRYYYFATFTNNGTVILSNSNGDIPRRASHVLVADKPDGPYRPVGTDNYCPADRPTLDGTFWIEDGIPYMVYCGEWLYDNDGTMEAVRLSDDLSASVGEPTVLFRASDSPWSHEVLDGKERRSRVTDGPWLFRTGTGRLGMIWTSWIDDVYTMGVAYSEGGLAGPWIQEPEPLTPPNHGHGMIFRDFDGRYLISLHSHRSENGRYIRRPVLFEVDMTGDKIKLGKRID